MEISETAKQKAPETQKDSPGEQKLTYEDAVAELETIIKSLERGEAKLEESGKLYERGIYLTRYCTRILNELEEKITELRVDEEGSMVETPLNQP